MSGNTPRSLDVEHLADLANLPLPEDERETLRQDCQDVLEAFSLPTRDDEEQRENKDVTFPDEPAPWPKEQVDAILDQAPHVDGRRIRE